MMSIKNSWQHCTALTAKTEGINGYAIMHFGYIRHFDGGFGLAKGYLKTDNADYFAAIFMMLTPAHCDLFCQPFFQFSQLKQYCPERIEPLKAAYKKAWQDWRETVLQVAHSLPATFASPHIERWCNGWQVRAHFFAYFKYADYADSAAILSLILNRKRLTVSLDWHAYRAGHSAYSLADYHQWLVGLNSNPLNDYLIWRGSDDEYGTHLPLTDFVDSKLILKDDNDFFRIGKHLNQAELANTDCATWIQQSMMPLLPLYEQIHQSS